MLNRIEVTVRQWHLIHIANPEILAELDNGKIYLYQYPQDFDLEKSVEDGIKKEKKIKKELKKQKR